MSIKISGTTVINDSCNITNVNNMCVGVVTITGSSGDIETPGNITAASFASTPLVTMFSPVNGSTGAISSGNIFIAFDQPVEKSTTGIGSTANIRIRLNSITGTILETIGITSTSVTINEAVVTINPQNDLPQDKTIFVEVDAKAFTTEGGDSPRIDDYSFTVESPRLGDAYGGGFLLCADGGVRWIVSPYSTELSRSNWQSGHAITCAQTVTGCTGWFFPSCGILKNIGCPRKQFWDQYSSAYYHTPTYRSFSTKWTVRIDNGAATPLYNGGSRCVRAFRCVTY